MADDLCLLQIHAHPDDEASKGAGTSAKYAAEGIRNVLVCCTGGEEGDILNPAMERPEVRADLAAVRMAELDASARAIGYDARAHARIPRLGHARHRGERATRQLRERAARGSRRAVREDHPRRAAAGDHHVPRRPQLVPAPRSHPRVGDLRARVRRGRRSRPVPRRGRAVAAEQALLRRLVDGAGEGAARGVRRARPGEPVRAVVRGREQHARPRRPLHDPDRRERPPRCAPRRAARARDAGRSRGALDGASPTSSSARSTRGRTTSSPAPSSPAPCPRAASRTTCSPASASPPAARGDAAVGMRHGRSRRRRAQEGARASPCRRRRLDRVTPAERDDTDAAVVFTLHARRRRGREARRRSTCRSRSCAAR